MLFTTTRAELERRFAALKKTLAPADGLWIAWAQEGGEDRDRSRFPDGAETGLAAGLVDNKSAAIDGDWQAVRFVYRRKDR